MVINIYKDKESRTREFKVTRTLHMQNYAIKMFDEKTTNMNTVIKALPEGWNSKQLQVYALDYAKKTNQEYIKIEAEGEPYTQYREMNLLDFIEQSKVANKEEISDGKTDNLE